MRLLLCVLCVAAPLAHAGRPFVTDDARIVDKGGCQIETFVKRQRRFDETEVGVIPACNPWGPVELSLGVARLASDTPGDSRALAAQAKALLRPLETNGLGFALSIGAARIKAFDTATVVNPYFNAIGSMSLAGDRVVIHANLGATRDKMAGFWRGTWGVAAEALLVAPRLYGVAEIYGERGEKPTLQGGLRYWLVQDRLQLDATLGVQRSAPPERRFHAIGLRVFW